FCDTDFVGTDGVRGGRFDGASELADVVAFTWTGSSRRGARRLVVCTGGEPLLQLDQALVEAFHDRGFEVALETNGTRLAPPGIDWLCVSPKGNTDLVLCAGDELKLVYPQEAAPPEFFDDLDFRHFFLQPMDGPSRQHNTDLAVRYCLDHPWWRLSIQ